MKESVTAQLLQKALGRLGGDIDRIDSSFNQLLLVGDLDTYDIHSAQMKEPHGDDEKDENSTKYFSTH